MAEDAFECPVCYDAFLPPVFQCCNGHLICKACLDLLEKHSVAECPTCRIRMTTRIRCLEADKRATSICIKETGAVVKRALPRTTSASLPDNAVKSVHKFRAAGPYSTDHERGARGRISTVTVSKMQMGTEFATKTKGKTERNFVVIIRFGILFRRPALV